MDLNNPNEPVLVVTNNEGKLVHCGHPESFKKKLLGEYAILGYNTKTITITEYREHVYQYRKAKLERLTK